MNQRTKYIATLLAVACTGGAGIVSAAEQVITKTVVTKSDPSAGQVAGAIIMSPLWLAGNVLLLPVRAVQGRDLWPSPLPVGEMTTHSREVIYTEPMATKHRHHKRHPAPVGEQTVSTTTTESSSSSFRTAEGQNLSANPLPVGEMTAPNGEVIYNEPMAIHHRYHRWHPVGERTVTVTTETSSY